MSSIEIITFIPSEKVITSRGYNPKRIKTVVLGDTRYWHLISLSSIDSIHPTNNDYIIIDGITYDACHYVYHCNSEGETTTYLLVTGGRKPKNEK